jgi:hypothetical protein
VNKHDSVANFKEIRFDHRIHDDEPRLQPSASQSNRSAEARLSSSFVFMVQLLGFFARHFCSLVGQFAALFRHQGREPILSMIVLADPNSEFNEYLWSGCLDCIFQNESRANLAPITFRRYDFKLLPSPCGT